MTPAKHINLGMLLLLFFSFSCVNYHKLILSGGIKFVIEVEKEGDATNEQIVRVLRSRLDNLGATGEITAENPPSKKINVKINSFPDMERVKKILLQAGSFKLQAAVSPPSPNPLKLYHNREDALDATKESQEVLPLKDASREPGGFLIAEQAAIIKGDDICDAQAVSSPVWPKEYQIKFRLKPEGAQKLRAWSSAHLRQYLAVVLNRQVYSAPFVISEIGEDIILDSRFTKDEAEDLSLIIRSGHLPASLKLLSEDVWGK